MEDMMHQPPQSQRAGPNEIMAQDMQQDKVANLIQQISPDNQLQEIQWRIKGYYNNTQTGMWEKIDAKAKEINPTLVAKYMSFLSSLLNQGTTLSNLSAAEINAIMKRVIEWLIDDLRANSEEYEIEENYTERTRIMHIILNNTFMVMKRAERGMESRRIFGALEVREHLGGGQQKKGFIDAFKFWK
jgi:hypothetical protein